MLVTDGISRWDEEFGFEKVLVWGLDQLPDGRVGIEPPGESNTVHLLKKGLISNQPAGYVAYEPEWVWFLDFAGIKATHNFYQYHIISQVFKLHRPEVVVELGTAHGALSLYLGVCGLVFDAEVHTFDINPSESEPARKAMDKLGVRFHDMDYMEHKDFVAALLRDRKSYVICDGDHEHKANEINTFSPLITPGSVISGHDYWAEFKTEDVQTGNLKPFAQNEWTRHSVLYATWIKE